MKLLYLSYYYKPDITAAAFRSTDFVAYLHEKGMDLRVVTTFPHKFQDQDSKGSDSEFLVKRIHLKEMRKRNFLNFILHYLSFIPKSIFSSFGWFLKGWKPDVVFISSPPIFVGISGIFLKYLLRCKLVLEIRDIWPDSAVAAGQLKSSGMAYKLSAYFERFLYRRSNGLVCVSAPMKTYLEQYFNKPICVAYNGPLTESIPLSDTGNITSSKSEIRLAYAGNLGLVQGMDQLIKAISMLKNRMLSNHWTLDIYGTGALEKELKEQVRSLGLENQVVFYGAIPKQELSIHLRKIDVLYLGLISAEALDKTIPSKLFDYLSFGKPILAAITGEGSSILRQNSANVVVQKCDATAIAEGIEKLDNNMLEYSHQARENVSLLKDKYTREVNCQKIYVYLQNI